MHNGPSVKLVVASIWTIWTEISSLLCNDLIKEWNFHDDMTVHSDMKSSSLAATDTLREVGGELASKKSSQSAIVIVWVKTESAYRECYYYQDLLYRKQRYITSWIKQSTQICRSLRNEKTIAIWPSPLFKRHYLCTLLSSSLSSFSFLV